MKNSLDKIIEIENGPEVPIRIESDKGKLSVSGRYITKIGRIETVTFTEDPEYCFSEWKIKDYKKNEYFSKEETNKVIHFENSKSPDTTFTLLQDVSNLVIEPVCVLRPYLISKFPEYSYDGIQRNHRIYLKFSNPISKYSIFYLKEEIDELKASKGLTDKNFLVSPEGYSYGYFINPEDPVFKNIQIVDKNDGSNLLKYFGSPFFDEVDSSIINIPPKVTESDLIPSHSEIEVLVNKDFQDEYGVSLASNIRWNYFTNSMVTYTKPVFNTVLLSADNISYQKADDTFIIKNGKNFYYDLSIFDSELGISEIIAYLTPDSTPSILNGILFDEDKEESGDPMKISKYETYLSKEEYNVPFNIELKKLGKYLYSKGKVELPDYGYWYLYFILVDKNGDYDKTEAYINCLQNPEKCSFSGPEFYDYKKILTENHQKYLIFNCPYNFYNRSNFFSLELSKDNQVLQTYESFSDYSFSNIKEKNPEMFEDIMSQIDLIEQETCGWDKAKKTNYDLTYYTYYVRDHNNLFFAIPVDEAGCYKARFTFSNADSYLYYEAKEFLNKPYLPSEIIVK